MPFAIGYRQYKLTYSILKANKALNHQLFRNQGML